jgi:hypothetical protein
MTQQEINEETQRQLDLLRQNLKDLMAEKRYDIKRLVKETGFRKAKIGRYLSGMIDEIPVIMAIVVALGAEISLVTDVGE